MLNNPIVAALVILLIAVLVAAFVAWIINALAPADSPYKRVAHGILGCIVLVIALVLVYGLLTGHPVKVG